MEAKYFQEAVKCMEVGDWRKCLVMLKNVPLDDVQTSRLALDSAYNCWKVLSHDSPNRSQDMTLITNTYKRVLAVGDPRLMTATDFLELSHIYINEGVLDGALKLIQLGVARGHGNDLLVVLQMWTLMTRGDDKFSAEEQMKFIHSHIPIVARDYRIDRHGYKTAYIAESSLPVYYVYLHCALHLQQQAERTKVKALASKWLEKSNHFVMEAYHLHFSQEADSLDQALDWFEHSEMWFEMGIGLHYTRFSVLLAEDSFWQAFLLNTSAEEPIIEIITSMRESKRGHLVRDFLENKVMKLFRWNRAVRRLLVDLDTEEEVGMSAPLSRYASTRPSTSEESSRPSTSQSSSAVISRGQSSQIPVRHRWEAVFQEQERAALKLQNVTRGMLARRAYLKNNLRIQHSPIKTLSQSQLEHLLFAPAPGSPDMSLDSYSYSSQGSSVVGLIMEGRPVTAEQLAIVATERGMTPGSPEHKQLMSLDCSLPSSPAHSLVSKKSQDLYPLKKKRNRLMDVSWVRPKFMVRMGFQEFKSIWEAWKRRRYVGALLIQRQYRRYVCQYYYQWARYRAQRANSFFYQACEISYNMRKMMLFRQWHKTMVHARKVRSANIIINSLKTTRDSLKFYAAMEKILGIVDLRRRYQNKITFAAWMKYYRYRERNHARVTIRFFLRRYYRGSKKLQAQLAREAYIARAEETIFKRIGGNPIPRYRQAWEAWRGELYKIRAARARQYLAVQLPRLITKMRFHRLVHRYRTRYESQMAYPLVRRARMLRRTFDRIHHTKKAQSIQRIVRMHIALRTLNYRRLKQGKIDMFVNSRHRSIKKKLFISWQIYLIHLRREARWALRRMIRFYRIRKFQRQIWRHHQRKLAAIETVAHLRKLIERRVFTRLKGATVFSHRLNVFNPFFNNVKILQLKGGFVRWLRFCYEQNLMTDLLELEVLQKADRLVPGVHRTAIITDHTLRKLEDGPQHRDEHLMPYEYLIPPGKILHDDIQFATMKTFKAWMTTFRVSNRLRRNKSRDLVRAFVPSISVQVVKRWRMAVKIQAFSRALAARRIYRHRISIMRNTLERYTKHNLFLVIDCMTTFKIEIRLRREARWQIQCAWRQAIARRVTDVKRAEFAETRRKTSIVSSIGVQRTAGIKAMNAFVYSFCISKLQRARESAERVRKEAMAEGAFMGLSSDNRRSDRGSRIVPEDPDEEFTGPNTRRSTLIRSTKNVQQMNSRLASDVKAIVFRGAPEQDETGTVINSQGIVHKMFHDVAMPAPDLRKGSPISALRSRSPGHGKGQGGHNGMNSSAGGKDIVKELEFQSMAFHSNMFRLKQTNIFIYDTASKELTNSEVEHFIRNCATIFCQGVTSDAVNRIAEHFHGTKMVFCGGEMPSSDVVTLLQHIYRRNEALNVQFSDCAIEIDGVVYFAAYIATGCVSYEHPPPKKVASLPVIRELSIDTLSFGTIGLLLSLMSLSTNNMLDTVILKNSKGTWMPCIGNCIHAASKCKSLKELRLYGGAFLSEEIFQIRSSITTGYPAMEILEFSYDASSYKAQQVADKLVESGKNRPNGARSVSVTATRGFT